MSNKKKRERGRPGGRREPGDVSSMPSSSRGTTEMPQLVVRPSTLALIVVLLFRRLPSTSTGPS